MENYIINKDNHKIIGLDRGDTVAFLGVKFADVKRFEKPVLHDVEDEVYATTYGNCCPQDRQFFDEGASKNTFYYDEFRKGLNFKYGEDCLNLNVYAPKDGENLPIILFIHGGGFTTCSSDEKPFDGQYLAREGVMCVCTNYRHNIFGYYCDDNVSNLAFYDMICAIKWLKKYARLLGGDPDNITLMGQSAGAISIQSLILLPEVKDMVKRAIMLSGAAVSGLFAPKSLALSRRFYKRVRKDFEKRGRGDIRTADYCDVFLSWRMVSRRNIVRSLICTMPVFDGEIVRKDLHKSAYKDKQMPCIISVTKDDLLKPYLESQAQKWRKKANGQTWLAHFYHDLPGDNKGAFHSCDLWYIFGLEQHGWRKFNENDERIAKEIRERYCAFAKNGNPNTDKYLNWNEGEVLTIE